MAIRWLTAFLDMPNSVFEKNLAFWAEVTGTSPSPLRGSNDEFCTLVPPDGDAYLRAQRIAEGFGHVHLDFHVDDPGAFSTRAIDLGASLQEERGYFVLVSPGGLVFCAVPHHLGEAVRPRAIARPLVDQVCLDIPESIFETEYDFWAEVTGWEKRAGVSGEFRYLERPPELPLRLMFQRLEGNDKRTNVRAHLDIAVGAYVQEVVRGHEGLGASIRFAGSAWTSMLDPGGSAYCITSRDPLVDESSK